MHNMMTLRKNRAFEGGRASIFIDAYTPCHCVNNVPVRLFRIDRWILSERGRVYPHRAGTNARRGDAKLFLS